MLPPSLSRPARCYGSAVALLLLGAPACERASADPAHREEVGVPVTASPLVLSDGEEPVLSRPTMVSTDAAGRYLIADRSDRDVKVYDPQGRRVGTVGRAGLGPGEFASLMAAQSYRDSVVAYDFISSRITVFAPDGRPARVLPVRPSAFSMRVLDDSLFLLVRHPGQGGNLLRIVRGDGSEVSSFFDAAHTFRAPQLRQLSAVFADGAGGLVHAVVFGGDSIFTFDLRGRPVAAAPIPSRTPLPSFARAFDAAGRRTQGADGRWFHDGLPAVMSLAALPDGRAALFIAPYDTRVGTDVLEGGEFVVVEPDGGRIRPVVRGRVAGGLMGRDGTGAPVLLGYADSGAERIQLLRVEVP